MRRLLSLAACAALALLSGCAYAVANQTQTQEDVYALYYMASDLKTVTGGDAIGTESVTMTELREMNTEAAAAALVRQLLSGPQSETLKNPIPAGTQLNAMEFKNGHATVDLSFSYSTLSGVSLTIADYCITLTLTQLPEIATVSVTVRGQDLAYRSSQFFSDTDLLLTSGEDVVSTVPVTLWFLNGDGVLTAVEQRVDLYEGDTQISALVSALEKGPKEKNFTSALPDEFSVLTTQLGDGVCYVNLSAAALPLTPDGVELQPALDALALSLTSLEAVTQVRYLVDGELADFYGTVPVAQTYPRESE